jgi:hypothetical protein
VHLLHRFLFLAPFFARLASKFEKGTNMTSKKIWLKKSKNVSKKAEFRADFKRWKSFSKRHKKVISKTSLTNMSKSRKSAYFRHMFAA